MSIDIDGADWHRTVKVVAVPECNAMKMYWGSGDISPRILNLGARWR
jgi:hypothetical protein